MDQTIYQKPIEINELVKQVKSELGLMRYYLITATIVLSTSWFKRPLRKALLYLDSEVTRSRGKRRRRNCWSNCSTTTIIKNTVIVVVFAIVNNGMYVSGFNLEASTTATRTELNSPPCSVKSLSTCFLQYF